MTTFKTNHGHTVEAANISDAIDKAIEKLQAISVETIGCRLKLQSSKRFTVPRHKGVEGLHLVFVPELPELISKLMTSIPRIEIPFSITADAPGKGDTYQVENTRPDGLPYLYQGDWEKIAMQHAYFTAACGVVKSGGDTTKILITQPTITDGHMHGIITCSGSSVGSVHASGEKLPTK